MSMKFLQSPCTFHRNRCLSWEPLARAVPDGLNFIVKTAACEERSRGRGGVRGDERGDPVEAA